MVAKDGPLLTETIMTREEFYIKYGEVKVKFYSYYKYTFNYKADLPNGAVLFCSFGGDIDSIYKQEVFPDKLVSVNILAPYEGKIIKDDCTIESFDDTE
jgi:hypothetical protein